MAHRMKACQHLQRNGAIQLSHFGLRSPLDNVVMLVHYVARPPPVAVLMVAHHRNGLLHERRPGHGAVKHDVLLLVHCRAHWHVSAHAMHALQSILQDTMAESHCMTSHGPSRHHGCRPAHEETLRSIVGESAVQRGMSLLRH